MEPTPIIPTVDILLSRNVDLIDGAFGEITINDSPHDEGFFRLNGLSDRLTLSFAPDGTQILDETSQLYDAFSHLFDTGELEATILTAFQTWTQHANLNVGVVSDSGDKFGTPGLTYGDSRFGDVRIGAIPMASDVYAVALSQGEFFSGTWSGDIIFNSNAEFESAEAFYAVALHEAGHAFGMEHSDDIASPMHLYGGSTELTTADISGLQQLYGNRLFLDPYDADGDNNNTLIDAAEIKFDGDEGRAMPSVVFGDVSDHSDMDFFYVSPDGYTGQMSFKVISDGISLFAPRVSIYNDNGVLIDQLDSQNIRGDVLVASLNVQPGDSKFYIGIQGNAQTGIHRVGSYSLVTTFDDELTVDEQVIASFARSSNRHWDQEDVLEYFEAGGNYLFSDDFHSDDDQDSANELEIENDNFIAFRYHANASLSDKSDIDFYKIEAAEEDDMSLSPMFMNVVIRSKTIGGMMPSAEIYFDDELVQHEVLVNSHGELVLQVANIEPESEYFIAVGSNKDMPFNAGNYELSVSFGDELVDMQEFVSGTLTSKETVQYHSLHVASSQLFHFALQADELMTSNAYIWATIYDKDHNIVYRAGTRDGHTFTSTAAYFEPGSYVVEVELISNYGLFNGALNYLMTGVDIGDPQGPKFVDPSDQPFKKNDDGDIIYPDDVITDTTFVFVRGISSNQSTPPSDDRPKYRFIDWYWGLGL